MRHSRRQLCECWFEKLQILHTRSTHAVYLAQTSTDWDIVIRGPLFVDGAGNTSSYCINIQENLHSPHSDYPFNTPQLVPSGDTTPKNTLLHFMLLPVNDTIFHYLPSLSSPPNTTFIPQSRNLNLIPLINTIQSLLLSLAALCSTVQSPSWHTQCKWSTILHHQHNLSCHSTLSWSSPYLHPRHHRRTNPI